MAYWLLWAGQTLNQNLTSKCAACMNLFMTLEHFLSHINKTYALSVNAWLNLSVTRRETFFFRKRSTVFQGHYT